MLFKLTKMRAYMKSVGAYNQMFYYLYLLLFVIKVEFVHFDQNFD